MPSDWQVFYRADNEESNERRAYFGQTVTVPKWLPSIHMPRWASRITLEITNIRVERLQDITQEDAKAEGVDPWFPKTESLKDLFTNGSYRNGFHELWDSINAKTHPWDSNPWVWVIEFRKVQG